MKGRIANYDQHYNYRFKINIFFCSILTLIYGVKEDPKISYGQHNTTDIAAPNILGSLGNSSSIFSKMNKIPGLAQYGIIY